MKLLVVGHPCANPVDQQFFAEVKSMSGWELINYQLPSNWRRVKPRSDTVGLFIIGAAYCRK
jgi:hypothetical protein